MASFSSGTFSADKLVPLLKAPNYGGTAVNNRKRKFGGNAIKAWRGNDCVSAHFNKRTMEVDFTIRSAFPKQWPSMDVETEIFERLNKAKFDVQPAEDWGFLDRKVFAHFNKVYKLINVWDEIIANLVPFVRSELQPRSIPDAQCVSKIWA